MKKIMATVMLAVGLLASNYMGAEATDIVSTPGMSQEEVLPPVQVNMNVQVGTGTYQVTSVAEDNRTVKYIAPVNQNCTKAVVPATITLAEDGNVYKVTSIKANAFQDCKKLRTIHIGSNVAYIGKEAFKNCAKLAKIEIPNSVISVGAKAFINCTSLKKVTIGNNVPKINSYTFFKCTSLETVVMGSGIKTIGTSAFSGCKNLKTIQINSKNLKTVNKNAFYGIQKKAVVKVPSSKVSSYTKLLKKRVPSTVTIKKK